jgi:hypothetical protein
MAYCLYPASLDQYEKVYQIRKQIKAQSVSLDTPLTQSWLLSRSPV